MAGAALRRAALLGAAGGARLVELAASAAAAGLPLPGAGPVRIDPGQAEALASRCGMAPKAVAALARDLPLHPLAIEGPGGLSVVLPSPPAPGAFVVAALAGDGDGWALLAPAGPTGLRDLEREAFAALSGGRAVWGNAATDAWAASSGFRLPGGSEALLMDERTGARAASGAFAPFPTLAAEAAQAVAAVGAARGMGP